MVESTVRANFTGDKLRFLQLAPTRAVAERVLDLWAKTPASSTKQLVDLLAFAGTLASERFAAILADKAVPAYTRKLFTTAKKQLAAG